MRTSVLSVAVFCCLIGAALAAFPAGTEFLGKGIDVTKGNLKPSTVEEVEASFGKPNIYEPVEDSDIDQTTLNAGQFSVSSRELETISEVTSEFSVTVSVSGSFKAFSGSASTTVRDFVSRFASSYSSSYVADSTVSVYKLRLRAGSFNTEFSNDVEVLPDFYDKATNGDQFLSFISKWGTHYIREATLGGRTTFRSFITRSQQKTFTERSVNVQAGMNAAFKVAVGVDVETSSTDTNYLEINQAGVEIFAFAIGGNVGLITDYTSWSATVVDNPMPIFADIVPYIYDIEDEARREALRAALIDYLLGSLNGDNTLEVVDTAGYFDTWNDGGSGADMDVTCRRPVPADGYYRVGDSTHHYGSWPTVRELTPSADFFQIAASTSSPILATPFDYVLVWADYGTGADMDGSFWAPVCYDGYRAIGYMSQVGYNKPSTADMVCVHDRCITQCAVNTLLWNDGGSGGDMDGALWSVLENAAGLPMNTAVAVSGYATPGIDNFFCLKRKCITPPLTLNQTVIDVATSYYSTQPPAVEEPGSYDESAAGFLKVQLAILLLALFVAMRNF